MIENTSELFLNTSDLKLASLILAHVRSSRFEILPPVDSEYSIIKVIYSGSEEAQVKKLCSDYLERRAVVNLWAFNRKLKQLRDQVKGGGYAKVDQKINAIPIRRVDS